MTNSQKVLALIRKHPEGLDDDELSEPSGISPRQQIYQICTQLESRGEIARESVTKEGKRKKIHNFPKLQRQPLQESPIASNERVRLSWQKRLGALVAATDKEEAVILDEALANYALEILRSQQAEQD